MKNMSNLPQDLVEEILSRVPLTSLRAMRSTCKKWNTLFKDERFTKKHIAQVAVETTKEREFVAIMLLNFRAYLMRVNLQGIHNNSNPLLKPIGKLISLDTSDQVNISRVFRCEGLLLCTTKDYTRLVVWNPYLGQTLWICVEPRFVRHRKFYYVNVLGYDKSKSCYAYKILRFAHFFFEKSIHEIYELNSNSWRVLDVTPHWCISYNSHSVSLKGNTYWFTSNLESKDKFLELLCFDFTTEKFGLHLPLPFEFYYCQTVTLSAFKEEQLAVLHQSSYGDLGMEIWITTKIEPNEVSWSKFLAVYMRPLTGFQFNTGGSFLIDEENRAVVVFDTDKHIFNPTRNIAYIIGENGYYREVDLGEITTESFPLACPYVPSSMQINQHP
ncbi:unnamed protein product [Arabidopsis lyrata]|uniref:F-box domain-containing protein n=1 Tax=Arabidopsis lyrata subsp. lyrata TaxID=81972 RepID=D7KY92_ARALL|nr:putative F-box protein At3g17620 [Arabidopsis lyrata subsp. lyrata]EFH64493.1 hypothetical protein ARALYDRAFT_893686 [Arabidopsis lyrata subsp. lyrata]CAH8256534.1 unnamed protein product [Arabidopsis lyrata]|eukprot:XP_002888234.1 putative F-box protein At3g17620 [Arabidopsis lyrata subsp. lyrata]